MLTKYTSIPAYRVVSQFFAPQNLFQRTKIMELHVVDSCIRGFHVYQDIWTPVTGECLSCETEESNAFDPYAVAIRKSANVIGHVPRRISAACSLFIQRGGTLTCIIVDTRRQYSTDLPQGGLQIPCKFEFKCDDTELLSNIKKLVRSVPPINFESKHHTEAAAPERKLKAIPDEPCQSSVKKQKLTNHSVAINLDQSPAANQYLPVTLLKKIHGLPSVDTL